MKVKTFVGLCSLLCILAVAVGMLLAERKKWNIFCATFEDIL